MSPSMSTPIDTITVSWWPWYEPSILTTWSRPRRGAREADGVHRGLAARVQEAPLGQVEAPRELAGDDGRVRGRGGEMAAERVAIGDGLGDRGVSVALHHAAEAVVEVAVLAAVDVPHLRAAAVAEVDRVRVPRLVRRGHALRHHGARLGEGTRRPWGRVVQAARLALRQLGDAGTIDLGNGRGAHGTSVGHSAEAQGSRRAYARGVQTIRSVGARRAATLGACRVSSCAKPTSRMPPPWPESTSAPGRRPIAA